MKTTLNPFENAKRTAQGTGGVSPTVIKEIQAEISVLGSQNETQAQDITDIKGSLNSINDNLTKLTANNIGTTVNISSYSSSFYEFSADGYVIFRWYTSDASGYTEVYGNNEVNSIKLSRNGDGTQGTLSLFVRKGMKAKCNSFVSAKNECFFKPIE